MYHHDPPKAIADMMYALNKDPMLKLDFSLHVYPNAAPNHHNAGAVFLRYDVNGAGIWTTMLGLAKALILAEERRQEERDHG